MGGDEHIVRPYRGSPPLEIGAQPSVVDVSIAIQWKGWQQFEHSFKLGSQAWRATPLSTVTQLTCDYDTGRDLGFTNLGNSGCYYALRMSD